MRQATLADVPVITGMVVEFTTAYSDMPACPDRTANWTTHIIKHGVIFLTDTGFIAGLPVMDPVRPWAALVETGWYAPGKDGLRLLRRFIQYAKDAELDEVRMSTLNTTPERALKLLEHMGFTLAERSHRLNL
jgi:hypothetical protein